MSTSDTARIRKTDSFVESTVDGDVVLMHIDTGRFFSMEATGREIWELLDEHTTIQALTAKLLNEYSVSEEKCRASVTRLIQGFAEQKIVEIDVA